MLYYQTRVTVPKNTPEDAPKITIWKLTLSRAQRPRLAENGGLLIGRVLNLVDGAGEHA